MADSINELIETEQWKPIISFPSYEVSNFGNVRSLDKYVNRNHTQPYFLKGIQLKLIINAVGYPTVALSNETCTKMCTVHRLVADAFIQKVTDKLIINHKDANKENNHYSNLEWCTHSENLSHAYKTTRLSKSGADNKKYGKHLSYKNSKDILDLQTGIFYGSVAEAANAKNIKENTLRQWLTNTRTNKSSFTYV